MLIEDQLRPPLDMITVDQERELQIAKLSASHLSWYEALTEVVSRFFLFTIILLQWIKKLSSRGCFWNIWSLLALNCYERTYCMPVMG